MTPGPQALAAFDIRFFSHVRVNSTKCAGKWMMQTSKEVSRRYKCFTANVSNQQQDSVLSYAAIVLKVIRLSK